MADQKGSGTPEFTFAISLSVLNHLGRHLYRSFVTILGEAVSNSWDADANNVWIHVNRDSNSFVIKDDGVGMTQADFQGKFLNIGFSKRKDGNISPGGRPYIGRKGIGKLALLSCAERVTIMTKTKTTDYVGGLIDNPSLDDAITEDLTPQQYPLGELDKKLFEGFTDDHQQGTLIHFQNVKGGIKNTMELLRKIVALYFRFSLVDEKFSIYINGVKVTYEDLKPLAEKTEFIWNVNHLQDPYVTEMLPPLKESSEIELDYDIKGFVASVSHYRDLNIMNLDEKVGIDLFVNGRLRERDILKRISKSRVVESYLYGQIHFNDLDDDTPVDRFTSSREGIIPDDEKYQEFLKRLDEDVLKKVISDWDKFRRKHREDGDPENTDISLKDRKSGELFNAVANEYAVPADSENKRKVKVWVDELADDAAFNFSAYADCFVSENLVRKFINEKGIAPSPAATNEINEWKPREVTRKAEGNINIDLRQHQDDLSYLGMEFLAEIADRPVGGRPSSLVTDGKTFRPIRNAVMHTALLTDEAKRRLNTVFENIKARVVALLS